MSRAILEGTEEDVSGRLEDFPEDNFCTFTALFDGLGTTPQFKVLRMSGAIPLRPVKPPPKRKAAPKGKQTVTGVRRTSRRRLLTSVNQGCSRTQWDQKRTAGRNQCPQEDEGRP